MKKMFLILAILFPIFLVTSCEGRNVTLSGVEPEERYPRKVPFEEYSLEESSCRWKEQFEYVDDFETYEEIGVAKILIINSYEELASYIEDYTECTGGNYPDVDFSKKTVLLTSGITSSGFKAIISKCLLQLSKNEYRFNVEVEVYNTAITGVGVTAIVVDKLSKEANVNVVVEGAEN